MTKRRREERTTTNREETLEGALKEALTYIQQRIEEEEYMDRSHWDSQIRDRVSWALGNEHYGTAGWGNVFVINCWLVLEVWRDGRIIPRCVSLTPNRAEYVKDRLVDLYEKEEPLKRPVISIEKQRMEHIFGFEMQGGRLEKTEDTFMPRMMNRGDEE